MTTHCSTKSTHFGPRHDVELQFLVHQAGPRLGQVALVEHQTVSAKAAGTAQLLQPLGPFGVQLAVGLLVLGLEHANDLLQTRKGREGKG